MKRRPLACGCLLILVFLYLGTLFGDRAYPDYGLWEGKPVTITGIVRQKEQYERDGRAQTAIYVEYDTAVYEEYGTAAYGEHGIAAYGAYGTAGSSEDSLLLAEQNLPENMGKQTVLCYLEAGESVPEIGSAVKAKGYLKTFQKATNPGQFDAVSYYQILKISFQLNQTKIQLKSTNYNRIREFLFVLQNKCAGFFDAALLPQDASVMKTMLLGQKRGADAEIKELYQQNGIAHILAISGLHISLLGMGLYKLLKRLGVSPAAGTVAALWVMFLYVCMTGFSVSALRALVMFGLHMMAEFFKRTYDLLTAACVAAVGIVLSQPLYLQHSGFLFSFGCIFALALVVPAMTSAKKNQKTGEYRERQPEGIKLKVLSGLSLTLSCLPLQLWFFYQLPLYSTFLNLLVIPLMGMLLPGGVVILLQGLIKEVLMEGRLFSLWTFIGGAVALTEKATGAMVTGILAVYESLCRLFSWLPGHLLTIGRPPWWKVVVYLLLLVAVVVFREHLSLKKKWGILLSGVLLLCVHGKGPAEVTFLDVGQGDCIHIHSENGFDYLVDGGSLSVSGVGEYRILPYLKYKGIRELEAVFITHPDSDHCNGLLSLLEECDAGNLQINTIYLASVFEEDTVKQDGLFAEIVNRALSLDIKIGYLAAGDVLQDGGMTLLCLHPDKDFAAPGENEKSMVLLLESGEFRVLLTGDVEGEGERRLVAYLKEADGRMHLHPPAETQVADAPHTPGVSQASEVSQTPEMPHTPMTLLKVSHHGSGNATGEELLELITPRYAVISCGKNNPYGHPHRETLSRLSEAGCEVFSTAECGAVKVEMTSGERISVSYWGNSRISD